MGSKLPYQVDKNPALITRGPGTNVARVSQAWLNSPAGEGATSKSSKRQDHGSKGPKNSAVEQGGESPVGGVKREHEGADPAGGGGGKRRKGK
jgi:hypothetical protein